MAGFKRGGFRGGGAGAFKKGYAKRRSPEDEEDAPHASKKSKGDDNQAKEEDATSFAPKLGTDDEMNPFVAVSSEPLNFSRRLTRAAE